MSELCLCSKALQHGIATESQAAMTPTMVTYAQRLLVMMRQLWHHTQPPRTGVRTKLFDPDQYKGNHCVAIRMLCKQFATACPLTVRTSGNRCLWEHQHSTYYITHYVVQTMLLSFHCSLLVFREEHDTVPSHGLCFA